MKALPTLSFPKHARIRFIVPFAAIVVYLSARMGISVFEIRETKTKRLGRVFIPALALAVLCLISVNTARASQRFAASLTGAQEVPPSGSAGTGYGSVILSDDQTTITVNLGFTGLGTIANGAHIHNAPVGVAGGIIFPLAGVPAATSGTFSQQTFAITPAQVTDLQNGLLYFNIHSAGFGGGEIRGQILLATCDTAGPIEVEATAGMFGPTAYASLTAAFAAINAGTHTGAINIDVCGNTDELAATATLNASGSGAALYTTINMSPVGGVARTIMGATTAGNPLIDLNGADNVTIDGLNTGGNSLTISNTTASGTASTSTIRFINDASSNTIQKTTISGSGTGTATGTILFSTTTGTTGNDSNTITLNNIGPAGANLPINAILGSGTAANPNNSEIISNNNIFDFFNGATDGPRGVLAGAASDGWTITGNSFYQTATRTFTGTVVMRAISIENTTGGGFNISNNFIGGSAPSAGGAAWTQAGAVGHNFIGIRISAGTAVATSVQNNTIQNISITNSSASSVPAAISLPSGSVNVGTITGNTIGSQSITGSITQTNALAGFFAGILSQPGTLGAVAISNNTVGGVTMAGAGAQSFRGIRIEGASGTGITISNNTIGSATTANSIQSNGNAALLGISTTNTAVLSNITGNLVANFQHTSTGTAASFRGVETTGAINSHIMSNNTIRDVSSASTSISSTATPVAAGIFANGISNGRTISGNTIFNLSSTTAGATAVNVIGILTGASASSGTMNGNLIYNLSTASTSATSAIRGIYLFNVAGTAPWNLTNNMIRLGTDVSATLNPIIRGINEDTVAGATNNIWFNSIFIGGTQGGATVNTAAVFRAIAGILDIRDNILWNNRASTGAPGANAGRHYCIQSAVATGTLTTNFNNLFADANGGTVGFLTSDRITLTDWRAAGAGFDVNSFSANPSFVDPTNATTPDLHLTASNPESQGGQTIASVTTDFDAQTRPQPAATNPDMGADEGNFTLSPDLLAPAITYTPLGNSSGLVSRSLTGFAAIVDNSGTVSGGANNPRLYYKKSTDANAIVGNTSADNGWKFVIASNGATPYDFTIDYSIIFGGTVSVGDTIQYFVVAQDASANVAINSGTFATTPGSVILTAANLPIGGTINSYLIAGAFTGSYDVGTGQTYTSLTGATPTGFFAAINAGVVTGNITVNIVSDMTEDGTNALNQWVEEGVGNYTMLIKPSGAPRMIVGTNTGALIRLNGADRVRIDGSTAATLAPEVVGGNPALRELTIQNTNTGTSAVVISVGSGTNGAQNNTIRNVNVLGQDPTTTLLGISLGGTTPGTVGTDNDNNRIENCSVKRALFGIYSAGASLANQNTGTVITMNETSDVTADRIRRVGIVVFNDNGIQITENSINGVSTNESADAIGIGIGTQAIDTTSTTAGGITNALVARNKINGVASLSTVGFSAAGITVAGATGGANTIQNNFITGVTAPSTAPDIPAGIYVVGAAGSSTRLYHNSIAMTGDRGVVAGQTPSFGVAITGTDPTVELKNNIFYTTQIASGGGVNAKSYAIGMVTTTFVNLDSNRNDFFSSGANAGFFRSGSLGAAAGIDYGTLALWQAAVADDANSQEIDPVYVNPLNDLHLNGATTPLLGDGITGFATVDFDNDPRPAMNPDIGADELVQAVGGVIPAGTYYNSSAAGGDSLGGNVTITNTLYLNGILSTGANAVTINCGGMVVGGGANNYIIGNLKKTFCGAGGLQTFEVGTANGFSPVDVSNINGTFPALFHVNAVQGPHPNVNAATSIQRYWTLAGSGITADLTFKYLAGDVMGTETSYRVIRISGGTAVSFPGSMVNAGAHTATLTGVNSFSDWTVGQPNAPTAAPASISGQVTTTSGAPLPGVTMYLSGARSARTITDSNGNYRFVNVDTDNFYTVTPSILNYHFSPASRSFSLLANMTDAVFTGTLDSVITGNVIDTPEFFVRQHYLDFLGREPDSAGLNFWSDQILGCGNDFNCIERRTINVSAAYFLSIEFQETGGLVDGLYRASYDRAPLFSEFMPDTATVALDVIVNETGWQDQLATNKQEFLDAWVQRAAFRAAYDNLSDDSYVDTLVSHTGVNFTDGEREALLGGLANGTLSRAQVLQRVAQNERFVRAKFNEAFVRMQYFGYLRRDPDDSGFHFWLNKLNEFEGNFERAEMVKAFLVSGEYRERFRQ